MVLNDMPALFSFVLLMFRNLHLVSDGCGCGSGSSCILCCYWRNRTFWGAKVRKEGNMERTGGFYRIGLERMGELAGKKTITYVY